VGLVTLKQRGRIYGSAITIPGNARIQDGDGTALADVVTRADGPEALCVDTEMDFYTDNTTINNVKNAVYLATLTVNTTGLPDFLQLSPYGCLLTSDVAIHQGAEAWTWNTNGTLNTYAITMQGKTFTTTYVWNANGTLASSSVAVT